MLELIQAIPFSFAALFPVVNPIGSSVIFLSLVSGSSKEEVNKLAFKISLYSIILLIIVLVAGSEILRLFGITIPIVLIGGGLVLAHIGWQLLNQPDNAIMSNTLSTENNKDVEQMVFYPLTMPVTAGPGCIAVAIALGAHSKALWQTTVLSQLGNSIGIVLVGITIFFCYRYAYEITHKLGATRTRIIIRLAAFINLCIGLQIMWHGIQYLK